MTAGSQSGESLARTEPDPLSELARQRREVAEIESARPKPDFVASVEQSEVLFTFHPSALPYRQIDALALNDRLVDAYSVEQQGPDFSPLLSTTPREQLVALEEAELMKRLVRASNSILQWREGRFPLRDGFVGIRLIGINRESIHVSVAGVSQVAEVIVSEVAEILWDLVGVKKKYSDVEPLLQMKGYGTSTRLSLGYGPECLLNPALMTFLENNLTGGRNFASSMGRAKVESLSSGTVQSVPALDDLTLRVAKFDPMTGYSESSDVNFSITAQSEYRTGRLRATTELPYEKHVEFLSELFSAVRQGH